MTLTAQKSVLIVDDSAYVRQALCELFKREGDFEVRKAMIPKNSRFNSGIASTAVGSTGNTQGGGFNWSALPQVK